ncbi:HNH endonuclease [Serratia oryzae]|uniref:HNH endonuclease n=1 Tax=Serratia oryzae TaxID=2034155 RepID=UPI0018CF50D0|nr:HNH endonuclease signature motif containing protein [Serratia oryzae]
MTFKEFEAIILARKEELKARKLKCNITQAQWAMLRHLFDQGTEFPKGWVTRDALHSLVNQSDYRRRLTELSDDIGVDIQRDDKNNYRLHSPVLKLSNPRNYLTKKQKDSLLAAQNFTCQICGFHDPLSSTGSLQADHKIPLAREGGHEVSNWQILCHVCNVGKRRACEGCSRDCRSCVWAFPQIQGIPFICSLTPVKLEKIAQHGVNKDQVSDWLNYLIDKEINE